MVRVPTLIEVPYRENSAELFEALAADPWAVFLDSGRPFGTRGRYDIIATAPAATVVTRGEITEVRAAGSLHTGSGDPLDVLRECLGPKSPAAPGLPFSGGAIGYFAYDLGRRFERLPARARDDEHIPEMAVGLYEQALVVDHQQRRAVVVCASDAPRARRETQSLARLFADPPRPAQRPGFDTLSEPVSSLTRAEYARAFDRVKSYIDAGDCYQVNLAQRFAFEFRGDPWAAYRSLRSINPSPFGGFLRLPFAEVLSCSPERFLELRGGQVETRPIKGTRPRGRDPEGDSALACELEFSEKDRAENVMIVDLLRNDLGRVCATGSIRVPSLFAVECYATVHHLVSTVRGMLPPGRDALDLLRACFPGGSITGAPKLRAMEIIEELEPQRRGVYCGSIGYLSYCGDMDTNIAIRTAVGSGGVMRFWAGGGIVADSEMASEYQETLDKAAAMLRLFRVAARAPVGG